MSSNTPTRKFEDSVREGLESTEVTPEEFDQEEAERRRSMARAFAALSDGAPKIVPSPDGSTPGDSNKRSGPHG